MRRLRRLLGLRPLPCCLRPERAHLVLSSRNVPLPKRVRVCPDQIPTSGREMAFAFRVPVSLLDAPNVHMPVMRYGPTHDDPLGEFITVSWSVGVRRRP